MDDRGTNFSYKLIAAVMHPKELAIADYTYILPDEKIAAFPLADRDGSKLLVYKEKVLRKILIKILLRICLKKVCSFLIIPK